MSLLAFNPSSCQLASPADLVNLLNPNIKIQILICYPYTFSIEVVGRILLKYQLDSSCVIMSLILMTTLFYKTVINYKEKFDADHS